MTTATNLLDSFRQAIEAAGLTPPDEIVPDGRFHHFASSGDHADKAGWYKLHGDGLPAGAFGCFRLGLTQKWCAKAEKKLTDQERREYRARIKAIQQQRDEEERQCHAEAAQRAQHLWSAASPAPTDHPYLVAKQIQPHGLRIGTDGWLLVPVRINGVITSLLRISPDGDKKFLSGGEVKGGSFMIGEANEARPLLLGEGVATMASLHEATGYPVVMALFATNLMAVATQLRQQYPTATIVLCGDNDFHADGKPNTGVNAATAAAEAIGGHVVIAELDGTKCDFNDVAQAKGHEAVRETIEAALHPSATAADSTEAEPWPVLDAAALYGLPGDIVRLLSPHTEADPVALLVGTLSEYGCAIGRQAHLILDGSRHSLLLWALLVGKSSKSRKGSSDRRTGGIIQRADPLWIRGTCRGTLSTGEGLANAVRDPTYTEEADKKTGELQRVCTDSGIPDKRLFLVQTEFSSVLRVMHRDGNSLSGTLRDAWDGLDLCPMTKNATIRATAPHVTIVGHTTADELRRHLTDIDISCGLGNRFIILLVKRAQELPDHSDPALPEAQAIAARLKAALQHGRTMDRITLTDEAREDWRDIYSALSADRPGIVGALLGRAEAYVQRLAAVYCLLDLRRQIEVPHLAAALALWSYVEDSTRYLFGHSTGDPDADAILAVLQRGDLSDTEISHVFGYNRSQRRLDHAKQILQVAGLAICLTRKTGGRPVRVWHATKGQP